MTSAVSNSTELKKILDFGFDIACKKLYVQIICTNIQSAQKVTTHFLVRTIKSAPLNQYSVISGVPVAP